MLDVNINQIGPYIIDNGTKMPCILLNGTITSKCMSYCNLQSYPFYLPNCLKHKIKLTFRLRLYRKYIQHACYYVIILKGVCIFMFMLAFRQCLYQIMKGFLSMACPIVQCTCQQCFFSSILHEIELSIVDKEGSTTLALFSVKADLLVITLQKNI